MKSLFYKVTIVLLLTGATVHAQSITEKYSGEHLLAKNEPVAGIYASGDLNEAESTPPPAPHGRHNNRGSRFSAPKGMNILSGSPFNFYANHEYIGVAFAVTYERLLDKDQRIGLQLPVHVGFATTNAFDNDDATLIYTTPGLQFHVNGADKKVDYAVGPSLLLGNLNTRDNRNSRIYSDNSFVSGILIDNNLNFQHKQFMFGLHLSLGATFPQGDQDESFFFQFGIRFGGRF